MVHVNLFKVLMMMNFILFSLCYRVNGRLALMFGSQKALLGLENTEISNKYGRSTRINHMQEEFVSFWIGMGIIGHRYEEN